MPFRALARVKPVPAWQVHRAVYIALALALSVAAALGAGLSLLDAPLLAGTAMLLLGVPHGAFDVALAHRRWKIADPRALTGFLTLYVGLAAGVVALWFALPQLALPAFILMSGCHFSGDWAEGLPPLPRVILGLAMICAPAVLHREAVTEIFAWLAPAEVAATTAQAMAVAAIPLLQAAVLIVLVSAWTRAGLALEMASTLMLALFAAPLLFFLVYWCGLHSPRHMLEVRDELKPASLAAFARLSLPYAPLAIAGVLAGALLLPALALGEAVLAALFIALAALTVPHMLLVDLCRPRGRAGLRVTVQA
jgi:Brp/Blh family beta-carotene 15,15'-monooxygenase